MSELVERAARALLRDWPKTVVDRELALPAGKRLPQITTAVDEARAVIAVTRQWLQIHAEEQPIEDYGRWRSTVELLDAELDR